ncbi:MAG TPA: RNA pseudouridine synthase, partial [Bdellovibrionales bacterium]|nr:RNA pseudouridine synthase [Bdellovibrionales bacterium]
MLRLADKPAGLSTHTSLSVNEKESRLLDGVDGFLEYCVLRDSTDLWPVHRLDKETTGAIVFARSKEVAEKLRVSFETRDVKKRYLFITDRRASQSQYTYESLIEKRGKEFVSTQSQANNSRTQFKKLGQHETFSLWEALPESGRPHQIRLHAQDLGIPILGDSLHAGSEFPSLCLHSASIEFSLDGESIHHESQTPRYFSDLTLLSDRRLCAWLAAIDRRERLLKSHCLLKSETLRWIHTEGDPLRVEQLGSIFHFSWFADQMPSQDENRSLKRLCEIMGWKDRYLQLRGDRGRTPNEERFELSQSDLALRW